MNKIKPFFMLDPNVIFLNHGSFGACPRPVFEDYQKWQKRLESQPVLFLGREYAQHDRHAREVLGQYLSADPDDLAFIPNATYGVNLIARSIHLNPNDEILTSDHEYGACDFTWEFINKKTGAAYIRQHISFPAGSPSDIAEQFWMGVSPRTKIIFLSHITSPTALRMPVEIICKKARQNGILTIIDGAHAPGQIPLNLQSMDYDFYIGNCHKWMLGPKGAGFLYVRKEYQKLVEPLIVSWGLHYDEMSSNGSQFIDFLQWTGTRDPAAEFAIPSAIEFMEKNNWIDIIRDCSSLLQHAITRIGEIPGFKPIFPDPSYIVGQQMGVAELPTNTDILKIKAQLYDDFRIEIPLIDWQGRKFIRISIQGYNTEEDIDAVVSALKHLTK